MHGVFSLRCGNLVAKYILNLVPLLIWATAVLSSPLPYRTDTQVASDRRSACISPGDCQETMYCSTFGICQPRKILKEMCDPNIKGMCLTGTICRLNQDSTGTSRPIYPVYRCQEAAGSSSTTLVQNKKQQPQEEQQVVSKSSESQQKETDTSDIDYDSVLDKLYKLVNHVTELRDKANLRESNTDGLMPSDSYRKKDTKSDPTASVEGDSSYVVSASITPKPRTSQEPQGDIPDKDEQMKDERDVENNCMELEDILDSLTSAKDQTLKEHLMYTFLKCITKDTDLIQSKDNKTEQAAMPNVNQGSLNEETSNGQKNIMIETISDKTDTQGKEELSVDEQDDENELEKQLIELLERKHRS